MLQILQYREWGHDNPRRIVRSEAARRAVSLDLSKYQDLEPIHTAGINSLDIDPVEQRYLLSGAANGLIAVHDLHVVPTAADIMQQTYPAVCKIDADNACRHRGSVETVQWYPVDTGMFVSSGNDTNVKVWDTNMLRTVSDFQFAGHVYCHDISSIATHHSLVAVASGSSRVQLLDLKSSSKTHTLRGHRSSALVVRWSPRDEHQLATGGEDGQLLIWDVRSARGSIKSFDQHNGDSTADPNSVNTAHGGRVIGIRFMPDGLRLLSVGSDRRIRLWDVASVRNTMVNYGRIELSGRTTLRFATTPIDSGFETVYVPSSTDIVAFGVEEGQRVGVLRGHYKRVNCAVYCAPMRMLLSGSNDRAVVAWTPSVDEQSLDTVSKKHRRESGGSPLDERTNDGRAGLGAFARRIGGGTADAWSDED